MYIMNCMNISEFIFLYIQNFYCSWNIDWQTRVKSQDKCLRHSTSVMLHINLVLFIHAIIPQSFIYNKHIKLTVIQHKSNEYDNKEISNILLLINGNIFIRVPDINRILNDTSYKAIQGIGCRFLWNVHQ